MKYLSWDGAKALMDKIRISLSGKSDTGHSHSAEDITSGDLNISRIADNSIPLSKMQSDIQDKINYPTYHSGDRFSSLSGKGWHRIAVFTNFKTSSESPIITLDGFSNNLSTNIYFNCTFSICPRKESTTSFVQLNCSYECYAVIPKIRVVRPSSSIKDVIYIDIYHYYDNYLTLHASISNAQYVRFVDTSEFNPAIPNNYKADEFEISQKCGIKCNYVNDINLSALAYKDNPTFAGLVKLQSYNAGGITYHLAESIYSSSNSVVLETKITAFDVETVLHIYGSMYELSKTIDIWVFIKYSDGAFGECSAVSFGTYEPSVKLFIYRAYNINYIGVVLVAANTTDIINAKLLDVDAQDDNKKYNEKWLFKYSSIPDNSVDVPISKPSYNAEDISGLADVAISGDYNDLTNKPTIPTIPSSLPANGGNADTVNNHTVESDVPENALFTDTVYDDTEIKNSINKKQNTITGGASTITSSNLTANRALVSNASGKVAVSAVTSTELGYLDGVTGNVQTQLNGKQETLDYNASDFLGCIEEVSPLCFEFGEELNFTNYAPQVNGVDVATIDDLNSKADTEHTHLSADITDKDTAPTNGSDKFVTSGGVYTALTGKAPTSHASTATTYGIGTSSNYGHVKLSDSASSTSGTSSGIAATPSAVKSAYDLADTANTNAASALNKANIKKNTASTAGDIIDTHLTVGTRKSGSTYGDKSFVVGSYAVASGTDSFALGGRGSFTNYNATASGKVSVALGNATASGELSFAIGGSTTQATESSTVALNGGKCLHRYSVALGINATTEDSYSIATGYNTLSKSYALSAGRYNKSMSAGSSSGTTGDVFVVGIGDSSARKNGFRVDFAGNGYFYKAVSGTGADYAEMWEWQDGNPNSEDRVGYFAAFNGDKIRLAQENDDLRKVGIISGNPAVVGDNFADEWCGMYLQDIYGRNITEHKSYDAEYDEDGNLIHEAYEADEYVLNPDYDPNEEYIPRQKRKEWDAVGTHGKLVVRDDGTCKVDGFCKPANGGIATASDTGFYVMERVNENHIRVYIR